MKCQIHTKASKELEAEVSEELKKKDPTKCCIAAIINSSEKQCDTKDEPETK